MKSTRALMCILIPTLMAGFAACALQAEVEPLAELRVRIGADVHADVIGALRAHDLDRAGIERIADVKGFGH